MLYNAIKSYLADMRYYIGFIDKADINLPVAERFNKIKWLKEGKYSGGWFADPFIYKVDDRRIQLFVEEWVDDNKKGRISFLNVSKTDDGEYVLEHVHPMLELDTHLSYPIYIHDHGKVYVYPENYQSGKLVIYEYDESNQTLINPCTIIDEPLVDTSIVKIDGSYFAFGTLVKHRSFEDTHYTYIYKSDSLLSGWSLFQIIENSRKEERGAGRIIEDSGRLIRPVQNCEHIYGEDIIMNELLYENGSFSERYLTRLEPNHNVFRGVAMHTYNELGGLCVIDGQEYKRYHIARLIKRFM